METRLVFLSYEDQVKMPSSFVKQLPWNSFGRKNVGYLYAITQGANVIFDTWVHPLVMGLEEHLLHMFREDFEFNDSAGPSHLGSHKNTDFDESKEKSGRQQEQNGKVFPVWEKGAELELKKIPFFVRGKARRNTESFAKEKGISSISTEILYEAKAHYAR